MGFLRPKARFSAWMILNSSKGRTSDDPRRTPQRFHLPRRPRRAGTADRLGLRVHRGTDLASGRALSAVLRHAGRRASAVGRGGRGARGHAPLQQVQRHDLRCGPEPRHLRARDVESGAPAPGRAARGPRLALRGQGAQQPERRLRALRRIDLLHRSVVRADAGFRRRTAARARLAGRVPRIAGREARSRGRQAPVRPAERTLLLARREPALRQRHDPGPHPGVRRGPRRIALARAALRTGNPLLAGGRCPRRDEVRRQRQRLGHRTGRHPGLLPARRAARHRAHSGDAGEPALGRSRMAHPVRLRDDLGVRGGDEGRSQRRTVHAAWRR